MSDLLCTDQSVKFQLSNTSTRNQDFHLKYQKRLLKGLKDVTSTQQNIVLFNFYERFKKKEMTNENSEWRNICLLIKSTHIIKGSRRHCLVEFEPPYLFPLNKKVSSLEVLVQQQHDQLRPQTPS